MPRLKNALCAMVLCALSGCVYPPYTAPMKNMVSSPSLTQADAPQSATLPFVFDDNRMFVELMVVRPDGSARKALAFVNMGQAAPVLSDDLYRELQIDKGKPLDLRFGAMRIRVNADGVETPDEAYSFRIGLGGQGSKPDKPRYGTPIDDQSPFPVELVLSAGILQNFEVAMDYGTRTLTLARPGALTHEGTSVPVRSNDESGLITVDAVVGGQKRRIVIDNGGSYTVFRASAVNAALDAHPEWERGIGAVGEANTAMSDLDVDAPMLRATDFDMGSLHLPDVGIVGSAMGTTLGSLLGDRFWDYYSAKAGVDVDGWMGGNVLKGYRLTIDYANRATYWLKEVDPDAHDLDQVGITLSRPAGRYLIAGVAQKDGKPAVDGVAAGDVLVQIDGLKTAGATRGQVLTALHGSPGERRHLLLERDGKPVKVDAPVTAF